MATNDGHPAETSGPSEIQEHLARSRLAELMSGAPLSAAQEQHARDLLHASTPAVGKPGVREYLAGALATIDELRQARNAEASAWASTEAYIASLEKYNAALRAQAEQLRHHLEEARDAAAGWYLIDCLLDPRGGDAPVEAPRRRVALVGGPADGRTCQALEPLATTMLMISLRPGADEGRAAQYLVHATVDRPNVARPHPPDGARLIGRYGWCDKRAVYEWTESSLEGK